ncbi:coiled-coil domain-containing protein 180 isoform X3 [Melanotaenia boesemani]|uniref:coiled-coil domain-containing protein 180 isoform X3 n=1 Tax=Melanotaenia boesemani TaxID=1250792 RepID=UPI001C040C23|nr:coiled-coil domain-containing protein 180 isoform X3 [Melanotaenia boesemani]
MKSRKSNPLEGQNSPSSRGILCSDPAAGARPTVDMCESRAIPSGEVYRQLFDAQAQLSRGLLAGRRDMRMDCVSAEDSNIRCSSRFCSYSSKRQQVDDEDDVISDVASLPDSVEVDRQCSDIINQLMKKKSLKNQEAVKQLETHMSHLSQVCETQVRTFSLQLLESLQDANRRLGTLMVRMRTLQNLSLQEVCALWEEVEEEVTMKKVKISELNLKLSECERQRSDKIRAVLKKYCCLLEEIGFLSPPDIHRLIHTEATMLNQSLLANRRSIACLLLHLQEENLQRESVFRHLWEDGLSLWKSSKVDDIVSQFRSLCISAEGQQLVSDQQKEMAQHGLNETRCDIIRKISFLVPPTCSPALVSDWLEQLTAVNEQIDCLHADFLHELRHGFEQTLQDYLAQVECCKEALSALQLSDEQVNDIVSSRLLSLIGQRRTHYEARLAALHVYRDSVARHALSISRCVFVVMQAAALLWETHNCRLRRRKEELHERLDDMRRSQQQHIKMKKENVDDLLRQLRQGSSEDSLKTCLDEAIVYLQDIENSYRQHFNDLLEVPNHLPAVFKEEVLSYSSSLSSFLRLSLSHTHQPLFPPQSPEDLQNLHPSSTCSIQLDQLGPEVSGRVATQTPDEMMAKYPISFQNDADHSAYTSQDWLTEAESSLLELCDIRASVTITSSGGVVYSGPTFKLASPDISTNQHQETHLSVLPVELLTYTLNRTRTLFLDHLEQHFHDCLRSAAVMVTNWKEALCSDQEVQLQKLKPEHIKTHIYEPRLAELQLHQQCVDAHCEEMLDMLNSCRMDLQELQTSISRRNQELVTKLSNLEDDVQTARSSRCLEDISSILQHLLDEHMKHTKSRQTGFRNTVRMQLDEARSRTAHFLTSFRMFSEGGDFAPQEMKMFQRRMRTETRTINETEEYIWAQLEAFESRSFQKVTEASAQLEEKLASLKSELTFTEEIHKITSSTQVQIKAQAALSNQHQSVINKKLEDVRVMMEDIQVSPGQLFPVMSSVSEEIMKRCQYLDFKLEDFASSAPPESRTQVQHSPPPGLLNPTRTGVDLLDDPVIDVIMCLNRLCLVQDSATENHLRGETAAGQSPGHYQQRGADSVGGLRKSCTSIRSKKKLQIFGSKHEDQSSSHSFSSSMNSVLWKTNDTLLQIAEDFYSSKHHSCFHLLPDSLDQWAESMQERLLGYQEQARRFLSMSREDLMKQMSEFRELLSSLPAALISSHEQQHEAWLRDEVCRVKKKLEEAMAASTKEKSVNVRQLQVFLSEEELQVLNSKEELRQQQLYSIICSVYLELQECVRARGEEFVTSLHSLSENLLHQLDALLIPAVSTETDLEVTHQHSEDSAVTMETEGKKGRKLSRRSSSADPPSSVTRTTTASICTDKCTIKQTVVKTSDAAVKRFKQLVGSELSCSDDDKQRQLSEEHSWNTHWRQQIHTLKLMRTY